MKNLIFVLLVVCSSLGHTQWRPPAGVGGGGGGGTVTSVGVSGGSTGLSTSGGPVTGAGTITLTGGPFLLPADTNGTARRADTNTYMGTKSGLAGKQASGNYVTALTGDGTASGPGPVALTLATVNSNVGTFGSATQSAVITVNGKGLGTAVSNTTITPAVGSITGLGTGVATWLATPSSANLASAITDETGSGLAVFNNTPTLITPILGTPTSGNLANCTFPTLNQNTTGSAASLTTARTINGVSFDGTANITVTAAAGTLSGATLASGVTASSLTSFGTSPSFVTPLLGTPTSGNLANCTFPTLNQNTTGSAASLTTPRTINGISFNGTANVQNTDTLTKAYGFYSITAGDSSIVWENRLGAVTIREIRAIRVGGTAAVINATKNGSSDLLTANYTTTTSMASAGTLQNNTLVAGDLIRFTVRSVTGTVTELFIQLTADYAQK